MKKVLSLVLSFTLLMSISSNAFAAVEQPEERQSLDTENIRIADEVEIKSLPEMTIDKLVKASDLSDSAETKLSNADLSTGTALTDQSDLTDGKQSNQSKANTFSTTGVTQSWTGTLANQGDFTYIIVTLAPKQILNTTLISPTNPNLNYDLFIYEVTSGGTLGNVVASSTTGTYFNTYPSGVQKTVDEGAAFINNTTQTNNYAVIVSATQGGSTADTFKLTVSLDVDGSYDSAEPNDSPYNAYGVTEGTVSGASLHVINDQDWFIWRATSEFISADISSSNGYNVEVYTANGNKLVLVAKNTDGSYPISTGVNYIRVFADESTFSPSTYSLSITPRKLKPAYMHVELNGDQGQVYPDYPEGRYFRFKDRISPDVTITSASGYAVTNQPVTLHWESGSWNESTGNKSREVTAYTNEQGIATTTITPPTSLGTQSVYLHGAIDFIHYYDIDGILISSPGVTSYTDVVYHFSLSEYVG